MKEDDLVSDKKLSAGVGQDEEEKKDLVEVEKKVLEFYRRTLFGSNYKTESNTDEKHIIDWCFDNAWFDMARTIRAVKDSKLYGKTKAIKAARANEISKLKGKIKACLSQKYKCGNINNIISACLAKNDRNVSFLEFHYGQSQKVVNMFFKYLYLFKREMNLTEEFFGKCHCPVDSITLIRLKDDLEKIENEKSNQIKIYRSKKTNEITDVKFGTKPKKHWSNLNYTLYNAIQELIDEVNGNHQTRLDYEFGWE